MKQDALNKNLLSAAKNGELEQVNAQILLGANVNAVDERNDTPLNHAIRIGNLGIVEALLNANANVNSPNLGGVTPLCIASSFGIIGDKTARLEILKALINKGAEVDLANPKDGMSPLNIAAQLGHAEVVEVLLNNGAGFNIDSKSKQGFTPLYIAALNGHLKVVEALIKAGADVNITNIDEFTALHIAAQNGHLKVAEVLLRSGAEIDMLNGSGKTPLILATEKNKTQVALFLIEKGADLKLNGENKFGPIHIAILKDNAEVVEALTKKGVTEDFNPLLMAFIGYDIKRANTTDDTVSLESVNKNFDKVVKALLKGKADAKFLEEQTKKITGPINANERQEAKDALLMLGGVISNAKAGGEQNAGSSTSPATSTAEMEKNILEELFGNLSIAKAGDKQNAGSSTPSTSSTGKRKGEGQVDESLKRSTGAVKGNNSMSI